MDLLVNLDVDDLEAGVRFYTMTFDLRVGRRFGSAGVELLGSTSPIYLLVKSEGSAACAHAPQTRTYERHWTPVHLDFVVPDIDAAVQKAMKAGATLEAPVSTSGWGRLALMADPFGHGFCFVQFIGRGYDAIANG
jgi:predicted enzyme related to lactoylglutathione lyase